MTTAILAPVPAIHLESALNIYPATMPVAFGTNAPEFFLGKKGSSIRECETQIFVYASAPEKGVTSKCHGICATGIYWGTVPYYAGVTDPIGKSVRPESAAKSDTPWLLFWLVRDLRKIPGSAFDARRHLCIKSKPIGDFVPRRPMLVDYRVEHAPA